MKKNDWHAYLMRDVLERVEVPVNVESNKEYVQIGIRSHGKGLFIKNQFWERFLETNKFSGFNQIVSFLM